MPAPTRTPEEIRASIEKNRIQLGNSIERLRDEVEQLTDWRSQLRRHQQQLVIAAAVAGFFLGGGFPALGTLMVGRRARRRIRAAEAAGED
jgi:hypothetical protein